MACPLPSPGSLLACACGSGCCWSRIRASGPGGGTRWSSCWPWRCARSPRPGTTRLKRSLSGRPRLLAGHAGRAQRAARPVDPADPPAERPNVLQGLQGHRRRGVQRGAVRPGGSQVHLLSVLDVRVGRVRAQREIGAKTNEIPELGPPSPTWTSSARSSAWTPCTPERKPPATWPGMPAPGPQATSGLRLARRSSSTWSKCADGFTVHPS